MSELIKTLDSKSKFGNYYFIEIYKKYSDAIVKQLTFNIFSLHIFRNVTAE